MAASDVEEHLAPPLIAGARDLELVVGDSFDDQFRTVARGVARLAARLASRTPGGDLAHVKAA
jgi:hypothetical protein